MHVCCWEKVPVSVWKTHKKGIASNFYPDSIATVAIEAELWRGNGIEIDVILVFIIA